MHSEIIHIIQVTCSTFVHINEADKIGFRKTYLKCIKNSDFKRKDNLTVRLKMEQIPCLKKTNISSSLSVLPKTLFLKNLYYF